MEHKAYLDMAGIEARHWWFRGRREILAAVIARLGLRPDAEILEIGSGTGGNFAWLSHFGELTAVETSETAREFSRAKAAGVELHAGMLPDKLPLGDRKFDLICLFDVLEHVQEDEASMMTIRKLLAPGSAAVITVPAYPALFGPHDAALHHKRRYERADLTAKLHGAGFVIEKLSFINMTMLPVAFTLRWFEKVLRRREGIGARVPAGPVNELLARVFGAEALLLPRANLPFGLSLLAVVRAAE